MIINLFYLKKKEIKDIICSLTPIRICFINPNEALTFQILDPVSQSPFQKFNLNNEDISEYQNLISKESFGGKDFGMLPFLVEDIHQYNSSKCLYISSIYGYVVVFNDEGKIEKTFKLIDKVVGSEQKRKDIYNENNEVSMISFPKQNEYLLILQMCMVIIFISYRIRSSGTLTSMLSMYIQFLKVIINSQCFYQSVKIS